MWLGKMYLACHQCAYAIKYALFISCSKVKLLRERFVNEETVLYCLMRHSKDRIRCMAHEYSCTTIILLYRINR